MRARIATMPLALVAFFSLTGALHLVSSASAEMIAVRPSAISLGFAADRVEYTPRGDRLLLASGSEPRLLVFRVDGQTVERTVELPQTVADLAIDTEGAYAYLIGPKRDQKDIAMVSRVSIADGDMRTLEFEQKLDRPSIALGAAGRLYLANFMADSIHVLSLSRFDEIRSGEALQLGPHGPAESMIYLKSGPAGLIDLASGGRYMMVSNALERAVSAVDLENEGVIDQILVETRAPVRQGVPLQLAATESGNGSAAASVSVGDSSGRRLLVLDLDAKFASFEIVQVVDLTHFVNYPDPTSGDTPLLLVSTDASQSTILVGNRASSQIAIFSRNDRTVETRNVLQLPFPPMDLDVSPNGETAAVVGGEETLIFVANPARRQESSPAGDRREMIRDAQRWLSLLGYPVGVVDGMYGAQTRAALELFQLTQGLKASGALDEESFKMLREAVGSPGATAN